MTESISEFHTSGATETISGQVLDTSKARESLETESSPCFLNSWTKSISSTAPESVPCYKQTRLSNGVTQVSKNEFILTTGDSLDISLE